VIKLTRKKKKVGPAVELGRRTVDYGEIVEDLENARKDLGYRTFSEFARQIARDWIEKRPPIGGRTK
jgi:hypothetical protein